MNAKLPIHKMTEGEFSVFKEKYLGGDFLDQKGIDEIIKLYKIGDLSTGSTCCDEMHRHGYSCIHFKSPEAGIVWRLMVEISNYKSIIESIHKKSKLEI